MAKKAIKPEMVFKSVYESFEMHYYAGCEKSRALLNLMKSSFLRVAQFPDVAALGFSIVASGNNRQTVAEMREKKMDYILDDEGVEFIGEEV